MPLSDNAVPEYEFSVSHDGSKVSARYLNPPMPPPSTAEQKALTAAARRSAFANLHSAIAALHSAIAAIKMKSVSHAIVR